MWLAVGLFLIILALLAYLDSRKPPNFPPGPKWMPILGCALKVFKLRKKTGQLHLVSAELSKQYGPVLGLKVGKDRIVIVYGGEAIREFLSSDDLAGRPKGPFFELRTFGMRKGVLLTDEEYWHEQRRYVVRQLREFGFGRRDMSIMLEDEAVYMIQYLKNLIRKKANGTVVIQMDKMCGIHILNTLWTMLAGVRYSPEDTLVNHLVTIMTELLRSIDMVGTLFSQFPILRFVAPEFSGFNMYMRTHKPLWDFIIEEVEKHKKTFVPDQPRDFIDVYLQMLNSKNKPSSFSETQLLALCVDLFIAGSETTSKSFGFCFTYLLLNPDVQRKAQEEIDLVVGRDRLPSLQDRPNMPYMEGLVLESIRMFMGRGMGVPHRALRDTTLCGYFIPKDTMVISNFHGVLRGAEFGWNDPDNFRPERYIKNGKLMSLPDTFIPFGIGKRRCMGETLAKANLFVFISALLQNFTFEVPPDCDPPSTHGMDGVTPGPKPFKALLKLR